MKLKPWQWILLAMIAAFVVGSIINRFCVVEREPDLVFSATGARWIAVFDYVGTLFMNLLKMVIVPLVFTSIVVGIAGLGKTEGFARLGGKTLAYYACSSLVAILIGLTLVNTFQPGLEDGKPNEVIRKQIESNEEKYAGAVKGKLGDQSVSDMNAVTQLFHAHGSAECIRGLRRE